MQPQSLCVSLYRCFCYNQGRFYRRLKRRCNLFHTTGEGKVRGRMRSQSGYDNLPDEQLVRRARAGELRAYDVLVARYQRPVYSYVYRLLGDADAALDVAQETFIAGFETLGKFQEGRKLLPWLFGISVNMVRRHRRTARKHASVTPEGPEGEGDLWELLRGPEDQQPEQLVLETAQQDAVRRLVLGLPEKYKTVMALRYIAGLQCDEIAEALAMPPRTVRVQLHRGRELLKKQLGLAE